MGHLSVYLSISLSNCIYPANGLGDFLKDQGKQKAECREDMQSIEVVGISFASSSSSSTSQLSMSMNNEAGFFGGSALLE
jgi:hypothetical protein